MGFAKGDPRINRNGPPRTGESLTDYLRQALAQPNDDSDGPDKRTKGQAIMDCLVELAGPAYRFSDKHDKYLDMLLDRIEGKPKQSMDINGNVSGSGGAALAMNPEKRLSMYAELQQRAQARKLHEEEFLLHEEERKAAEAEEIRARIAAKQAESDSKATE